MIDSEENHYKYIILYSTRIDDATQANNLAAYPISRICAGDNVILPYVILSPVFCRYNVSFSNYHTKIYYLKYTDILDRLETKEEYQALPTYDSRRYLRFFNNGTETTEYKKPVPKEIKKIEIDVHLSATTYGNCLNQLYHTKINTFITNRSCSNNVQSASGSDQDMRKFPKSLVYLKARAVHCSVLGGVNSSTSYTYSMAGQLKYLIITNKEAQNTMNETKPIHDENTSYSRYGYYFPFLPASQLYPVIQNCNCASILWNEDIEDMDLLFPNARSIGFQAPYSSINSITLPSAETFSGYSASYTAATPKIARFPNVRTLTQGFHTMELRELDLSGLESLTVALISTSGYGRGLKKLNCSSLTTCTQTLAFYNAEHLQELILPLGFKYSLDLSYNYCLTYDCIIDIFTKAATLEEGESFTLKLNKTFIEDILTQQDKDIILNKGWTLTFER